MILPAPPKKYGAWHLFDNTNKEWPDFSLSPERVPTSIHVCYDRIESMEEWERLGGRFHVNSR